MPRKSWALFETTANGFVRTRRKISTPPRKRCHFGGCQSFLFGNIERVPLHLSDWYIIIKDVIFNATSNLYVKAKFSIKDRKSLYNIMLFSILNFSQNT